MKLALVIMISMLFIEASLAKPDCEADIKNYRAEVLNIGSMLKEKERKALIEILMGIEEDVTTCGVYNTDKRLNNRYRDILGAAVSLRVKVEGLEDEFLQKDKWFVDKTKKQYDELIQLMNPPNQQLKQATPAQDALEGAP